MALTGRGMTLAFPRAELTETSLRMPADTTYEEWIDQGQRLITMERSVMWWLGDWWRFGEHHYGERAAQAAPTGYSVETLRAAAWVAEKFPETVRRVTLSWSHHRDVAALPDHEREYWLEEADAGEWSTRDLRARIKRGHTDDDPADEPESDLYRTLAAAVESLNALRSRDPEQLGASVPASKREAIAKALDKAGLFVGRIAYSIRQEDNNRGA